MISKMKGYTHSLLFKIALGVLLVMLLILAAMGVSYSVRFSNELDAGLAQQIKIPGQLMSEGLLDYATVGDRDVMETLAGESLLAAVVVGVDGVIYYSLDEADVGEGITAVTTLESLPPLTQSMTTSKSYNTADGVIHITPIRLEDGKLIGFLVLKAGTAQLQSAKRNVMVVFLIGSILGLVLTTVIILWLLRSIALQKISNLVEVVEHIEAGDLTARVAGNISADEIGQLQRGINAMASELEETVNTLEYRVQERTRDLQVAAEVSRQITTVLNLEDLLPELVEKTQTAFDLYFVSIFLYEKETQRLALSAGSGEAGQKMRAENQGYYLQTRPSLVAKAARERTAIIINDVSQEADRAMTPYLPNTQSEAVLPMTIGTGLIGVMDLQSEQKDRFEADDVEILTTLAKQIAVAVKNAQLYEAQLHLAKELREADLMKNRFLASMSHELRTPLNAIINFTEMVSMGMVGPVNEEQKDLLEQSLQSSEHLLKLINDVLDISKIQAGKLTLFVEENVNLYPELETAVSMIEPLLHDKPVQLVLDIDDNLPLLSGDRRRLRQIFLNLLANAAKFTNQGSITFSAKNQGDHLLFAVIDSGAGIAPEMQIQVFEPFIQTSDGIKHADGTGLGLPITKSLVEAHDGQIWVESELGEGSSFFVILPLTTPALTAEVNLLTT
ncbi:MAG: hypothetical protein CSA11_02515 [Chloroflexi bacterium]|nr:MAG: hypothetical protein CSA11_02515 [Chloroflexota bacterium]